MLGIALVLGLTLFMNPGRFGFRYLLPLASLLALALAAELARIDLRRPRSVAAGLIAITFLGITGLGALVEVAEGRPNVAVDERQPPPAVAMQTLLDDLTSAGVHNVYSLRPTLQWRILFESRETIIARWVNAIDRRPEYPRAVDRALYAELPVAIVGDSEQRARVARRLEAEGYAASRIRESGGRYFWIPQVDVQLVQKLGFELTPPEQL